MSINSQLRNWDGYSSRGQAAYDEQFEREMQEADERDPSDGYSDEFIAIEIAKDEGLEKKAHEWVNRNEK